MIKRMKQKIIDIGNSQVYIINIPETAFEGVLSTQDRIIIYLYEKLVECERTVDFIESENGMYRLKEAIKFINETNAQ